MDHNAEIAETLRLQELKKLEILDTEAEQAYDDVVRLAAFICETPIALVSLVDEDRQWFKAKIGVNEMETPRGKAFCSHAITNPGALMEVPNALEDQRFVNNPLVTGELGIRFYAGAPLIMSSGTAIGTVCVIDTVPRKLTELQSDALKALSRQVVQLLALRRANAELKILTEAQAIRQTQLEETQRQLRELNGDLALQTLTDALTGLQNRRALDRLLANEYARSLRTRSPLGVLMADVDHFKAYNDQYGHVAGDQALQAVAKAIESEARAYDHVARYGGEEFVVVLPDTQLADVRIVAERIRLAVSALMHLQSPITISLGIAMANAEGSPTELIHRADQALYQAKQSGRNQVQTSP